MNSSGAFFKESIFFKILSRLAYNSRILFNSSYCLVPDSASRIHETLENTTFFNVNFV